MNVKCKHKIEMQVVCYDQNYNIVKWLQCGNCNERTTRMVYNIDEGYVK